MVEERLALRLRIVGHRWRSLCAAAVVATAGVLLLAFLLRTKIQAFLDLPWWVIGAAAVCGMAPVVSGAWGRWRAAIGLCHPVAYPPLWVAGAVGAGMVLGLAAAVPSIPSVLGLGATVKPAAVVGAGYVTAAALVLGLGSIRCRWRRGPSRSRRAGVDFSSFDAIRVWLSKDHPIEGMHDDAFGMAAIAERIARRLLARTPAAQAIVGAYGAGKSSLLALVADKLRSRDGANHVRLVPVALWPFDTPRAAVEAVIQSLIDKLGEEVNVIALRRLPEAYADAMSAANSWVGALAKLQGGVSPTEALAAIDRVAVATGRQFVVWIEDLERFAGRTEDAEEKLNPIRALLFELDRLTAVTVVTATVDLRLRFDLEKIARYVEEIPRLPETDVGRLLRVFREGCRGLGSFFDPASEKAREELDGLGAEEAEAARLFGLGLYKLADALPVLCATPRTLKQALRSCLEAWEELVGEIDFDDVLVLSVLRESQPAAFALMQVYLDYWRGGGPQEDKERREVGAAWDIALTKAVPEERTRKAVQIAVSFLFQKDAGDGGRPQGVRQKAHANYWQRYLARERPPASERDQPVLEVLAGADDAEIAKLLADPDKAGAVEDFGVRLETVRVVGLLAPVVEAASRISPIAWRDGSPPGLIPLWRMWLRRIRTGKFPSAAALEQLRRAYDICVSTNPAVAAQIEHYFVLAEGSVPDVVERGNRGPLREYLRNALVTAYAKDPNALAKNLAGAEPQILLWLTWGLDRVRSNQRDGEPFRGWATLAPVILEATKLDPSTMLPQLACLVVKRTETFRGRVTYEFDVSAASVLFGDADRVLALFGNEEEDRWKGAEHVLAVLRAAGRAGPLQASSDDDDD